MIARAPTKRARRTRSAAFTLIEILVALSAGVLVSMAAFALSKNATSFFQHEARISTAQLALTLGLNRISADLTRASFLSSPNAKVDPMVCRDGSWGGVAGLNSLAGVTIAPGPTPGSGTQAALNSLAPERLWVGGSLDSSETFVVECVISSGGSTALVLQKKENDGAMARTVASLGSETLSTRLNSIFKSGRYVQLLDPATGFKMFGVIADGTAVSVAGDQTATVKLSAVPALPLKPASPCGLTYVPICGSGLLVSVVSRVMYDVRSLQGTTGTYAALVTPPAGTGQISGDTGRTELVRVEIDASGAERPETLELVSEYAVDLRFGITAVPNRVTGDNYNPSVKTLEIGTPAIYTIAGDVSGSAATPQYLRAVQVRFATRTRAPDRDADLPVGFDGRRLRYQVLTTGKSRYARMRTAYANVGLPNQGGFSLW
ncbi:Hypothetical protein A7982_07211 [Minicystis rosea]|nr:Hypothetical protein A7982_07211 [Minicystis rosea]